jgi:DNA-binding NtrC family response regulator
VVEVRLDFAGFVEMRALKEEVDRLKARLHPYGLVGESPPMLALRQRLEAVSRSEVPVVVLGETGTGKELVARALHDSGSRSEYRFVAENCGAFAEGVLQSELFGHERGAFTGAATRRRGLFEMAHGGTLFLDEVVELPLTTQAALLRVLQDGSLRRVGGEQSLKVDVRLVVASNRPLETAVREGRFREDLYYRLKGATLELPPLRERIGDLELLVQHFLGNRSLAPTPAAWRALRGWRWPGNVRELRAEVLRWTVFCKERVGVEDLAPEIRGRAPMVETAAEVRTLAEVVEEAEKAAIQAALSAAKGNLVRTARALGIDRNTLKRKIARF